MFDLGRIQNFSVADPGLLSRISDPNFFHPGSRVKMIPGSRIRIHIKELKYLTKKCSVSDPYSFLRIRIRIQRIRMEANTDPDPDPIRIQGFNDQKLKKNIS
jgi:hypothetical protein